MHYEKETKEKESTEQEKATLLTNVYHSNDRVVHPNSHFSVTAYFNIPFYNVFFGHYVKPKQVYRNIGKKYAKLKLEA